MPSIKISDFKGRIPKRSAKLLPENFAQTAENCDLNRGKITAIKDVATQTQTGNLITAPRKIYKMGAAWLSWDEDVDIVKADVGDGTERIYFTTPDAASNARKTSYRMATMRGAWFSINAYVAGSNIQTEYYVLIKVDTVGDDPAPSGKTRIDVAVVVGDTAIQVATKIASAINAIADFGAVSGGTDTVTITNAVVGFCVPPISEDCGFTVITTTLGEPAVKQISTVKVPTSPNPTSGAGYPIKYFLLGVCYPQVPLTVSVVGTGDGIPIRSVNYIHTYVTAWGEESRPSDATVTLDIEGISQQTQVSCIAITASGQYFLIDTVGSKFYVWYHIIIRPVTTISFFGVLAAGGMTIGDYFTHYDKMPGMDYTVDGVWKHYDSYERTIIVWYDVLTTAWDRTTTYALDNTCSYNGRNYKSLKGGNIAITPNLYANLEWWETDYAQPTAKADVYIRVTVYSGDSDSVLANKTFWALIMHGLKRNRSDKIVTITAGIAGNVTTSADSVGAPTGCIISTTVGSDYSADPGVVGRTGIRVDVLDTDTTAGNVAKLTAEVLNDRDDFTCDDPEPPLTAGTLVAGDRYLIADFETGDDFANVGAASNKTGVEFIAAGAGCAASVCTPTTWANDSLLYDITGVITVVNKKGGKVDEDADAGDSGFTVVTLSSGGIQTVTLENTEGFSRGTSNITHARVYRSATAENGNTQYQLVPPYALYNDDTIYIIGERVNYNGYVYYCHANTVVAGKLPSDVSYWKELDSQDMPYDEFKISDFDDDHGYDDTLGEVVSTEGWNRPPSGMTGLTRFNNGMLGGFVDNNIYFSEPYYPYAWPTDYSLSFPDNIVGLASIAGSIVVLTDGIPFILTGNSPDVLSQERLPYNQPCLAKRGIIETEYGVIYPCPDGLFSINMNGGELISKELFTKVQWDAYTLANMIGTYYDDRCFYHFNADEIGFYIDFKSEPFVIDIDHGVTNAVYDVSVDGDDMYFLLKIVAAATYELWKWRGHATNYKIFTWKSKAFQSPTLANFSCGRVIADVSGSSATTTGGLLVVGVMYVISTYVTGDNFVNVGGTNVTGNVFIATNTTPTDWTNGSSLLSYPVVMRVYIDGALSQTISGITDSNIFRIASGSLGRVFELELTASSDIDFSGIGTNPTEISI